MTESIQNDIEQFYNYEIFDFDSLDQVNVRKAIVEETSQDCPYTNVGDSV